MQVIESDFFHSFEGWVSNCRLRSLVSGPGLYLRSSVRLLWSFYWFCSGRIRRQHVRNQLIEIIKGYFSTSYAHMVRISLPNHLSGNFSLVDRITYKLNVSLYVYTLEHEATENILRPILE